jgi:hypothetical protein
MVAIRLPPKELETRMKPSSSAGLTPRDYEEWNVGEEVTADIAAKCESFTAECRAELERRFNLLLEYEGLGELIRDDSQTGRKWRALALSLAGARYVGLQWTDPQKKGGRPPTVLALVAAQMWKGTKKLESAIATAGVNRSHFFEARVLAGLADDPDWWRRYPPPESESGK